MTQFSAEIYRAYSLDLRNLSDRQLSEHFHQNQHEQRIYGGTSSTVEFLSMRWLRGDGLEVGAGGHPTRLFGNARALMNDCDSALVYGGKSLDFQSSIDSPEFSKGNLGRFDFAIASHVLEHADSLLRAIESLVNVVSAGGIVYIVLPDIEFLLDKDWLPYFDFDHHLSEYHEPLLHSTRHDQLYIAGCGEGIFGENEHAQLSDEYRAAVWSGNIPAELRFMHHKHNYNFGGWLEMIQLARRFFDRRFEVVDARYGHERMDCHFVLEVKG